MTEGLLQIPWWDYENWPTLAVAVGVPLVKAGILVVLTWFASRLARSWFEFATERTGADAHVRLIIGRTVAIGIIILGGITVLDTLGVPPATLVTFIGVVGIGISLALQDILKNFFAGTYLLFERPFRIGDEISIKDQRGIVEHIGVRTTRLRTGQNVLVAIPNAVMFAEIVLNRTNERTPPDPRVAADNERADKPSAPPPTPAAPVADGRDTQHGRDTQPDRADGSPEERGGRARSEEAGRPGTGLHVSAVVFTGVNVLRPVARGLASSVRATVQVVPRLGRAEGGEAASRWTAWAPRLRARARTAFGR